MIGFMVLLGSYVLMMCYDITFQKELPRWVFLLAALSLFIYQTLDAVDGKQARKTGSSSPMGQLFDHGCDSLVLTIMILQSSEATRMGKIDIYAISFLANVSP